MANFWDRLFGCFHEWGEWEQYKVYLRPRKISRRWGSKIIAAAYDHRQKRKCKKCGKVEDSWVRTEVIDND